MTHGPEAKDELRHLPVINGRVARSSIRTDGQRVRVDPADTRGRFIRARRVVFVILIVAWILLPLIPIGGHPALFLDVDTRRFYVLGQVFNAQDTWLVFFLVTGAGFGLVYTTALLGRWWCGWACPQTVFLESFYRPIQRLVMGPREARLRLRARGGPAVFARRLLTHALYGVASVVVAHIFVGYFVSLPKLWAMMHEHPGAHATTFAWMLALSLLFYVDFGIFREQFCVVLCPYGRLQSVLLDDDSLVVGYDDARGEPRGKGKTKAAGRGDCVDCGRCVVVCPTGIDIRNGLQIDCIACAQCVDACDEIMDKLGRAPGLVRYDSLRGLRGEARRILRPRMVVYTGFLIAGIVAATLGFRKHEAFEANLLRLPGAPFTRDEGRIRNGFEIHLVNKSARPESFHVAPEEGAKETFIVPIADVTLEPLASQRLPVFVTVPQADFTHDHPIRLVIARGGPRPEKRVLSATFLGAR